MVKLFCAIVGVEGRSFEVNIDEGEFVGDLKDAIKAKKSNDLKDVDADKLQLFLAKSEGGWLNSKDPAAIALRRGGVPEQIKAMMNVELDSVDEIGDLFGDVPTEAVHVLVSVQEGLRIEVDQAFLDALQSYEATAKHLKDHVVVQSLANQLTNVTTRGDPTPFVVLENSSGTGKTQMAFNLDCNGLCEVFYIVCAKVGEQRVYNAFESRSKSFRWCVDADMNKLKSGSINDIRGTPKLYLYGFIAAALRGDTTFFGPALRSDVIEALERRRARGAKPFIFFLDEFPRVGSRVGSHFADWEHDEYEKYLRTMRNVFRSLSLAVVVSSTNGTARTLFFPGERSRLGLQCLWCVVFPRLPAVISNYDVETTQVLDKVKNIFSHSRPLFVKLAFEYVQLNPYIGDDPLDYINKLADFLAPKFYNLKKRSIEFELGQFGLLLGSSFKLKDDRVNLIDSHFARLSETKASELVLNPYNGLLSDGRLWKCRCEFPPPCEDMLLHLLMTGGRTFRPLEQPLHAMMNSPSVQQLMRQRSNDGMNLEALVTAALVVASHRGGFGGVEFPLFLGVLLHELGVRASCERMELPMGLQIVGADHLLIPFLSLPNVERPDWFLRDWENTSAKFDNLCRCVNADRIDFRTTSNLISGECKDYSSCLSLDVLKQILERIPDKSILHLVVTKKTQTSYFTRELASAFLCQQNLQYVDFYHISRELGISEICGISNMRSSDSIATINRRVDKVVLFIELEPNC